MSILGLRRRLDRLEDALSQDAGEGRELLLWRRWDGSEYVSPARGVELTVEEALEAGFRVVQWVPWVPRSPGD